MNLKQKYILTIISSFSIITPFSLSSLVNEKLNNKTLKYDSFNKNESSNENEDNIENDYDTNTSDDLTTEDNLNNSNGNSNSEENIENENSTSKRIEITKQPESTIVKMNNQIKLNFDYESYNLKTNDRVFIQWYKDDKPLQKQVNKELIIDNAIKSDEGHYYAKISIGMYLFFQTNSVYINVEDNYDLYSDLVFQGNTPIGYYYEYMNTLKIDVFPMLIKDNKIGFNGEAIKVDLYYDNILFQTKTTSSKDGLLFFYLKDSYINVSSKKIEIVATFGKFVKTITLSKINKLSSNNNQSLGTYKTANIVDLNYLQNKKTKISDINFIGTHDSGTYDVNTKGIGMDANDFIKWLYNSSPTGKTYVSSLGVMQNNTIYGQLINGVRYLDIRLSNILPNKNSSDYTIDDIYITHGALYIKLVDFLAQVKKFIDNFPNELIFLDFNHFYPTDLNNRKMQQMVINYLKKIFKSKLVNKSNYKVYDPLEKFINQSDSTNNKNIITFFSRNLISDDYVYTSVNTDSLKEIEDNLKINDNILVSYWTGDGNYKTSIIKYELTKFLNLKIKYKNSLFVSQAFPNWDNFQYFSGFMAGVSGIKMDSWWNIGDNLTKFIIEYSKKINVSTIISVNSEETKTYLKDHVFNNFSFK